MDTERVYASTVSQIYQFRGYEILLLWIQKGMRKTLRVILQKESKKFQSKSINLITFSEISSYSG